MSEYKILSVWSSKKFYEWRWRSVVGANMVVNNDLGGDLRCRYVNNLFLDSS